MTFWGKHFQLQRVLVSDFACSLDVRPTQTCAASRVQPEYTTHTSGCFLEFYARVAKWLNCHWRTYFQFLPILGSIEKWWKWLAKISIEQKFWKMLLPKIDYRFLQQKFVTTWVKWAYAYQVSIILACLICEVLTQVSPSEHG